MWAAKENQPVLILEDDVVFDPRIKEVLTLLEENNLGSDYINLETSENNQLLSKHPKKDHQNDPSF